MGTLDHLKCPKCGEEMKLYHNSDDKDKNLRIRSWGCRRCFTNVEQHTTFRDGLVTGDTIYKM